MVTIAFLSRSWAAVFVSVVFCSVSFGDPYNHKGNIQLTNWRHDDGYLFGSLQVKYRLSTIAGEPLTKYAFRYDPPDESVKLTSIIMRARVRADGELTGAYVLIKNPLIAKPYEWGWDVGSSPYWGPPEKSPANPIFFSESGTPIVRKQAISLYGKNLELVDLEVIEARILVDSERKSKIKSQPHKWLNTVFVADEESTDQYVPSEVEEHFFENREPGKVFANHTILADSNIPSFAHTTDVLQWEDDDYVYARFRFRWFGSPTGEEEHGGPSALIGIDWNSGQLHYGAPTSVSTFRSTSRIHAGSEFTIVSRVSKEKVNAFDLRPNLSVNVDGYESEGTVVENPLSRLEQKPPQVASPKESNPLAEYAIREKGRQLVSNLAESNDKTPKNPSIVITPTAEMPTLKEEKATILVENEETASIFEERLAKYEGKTGALRFTLIWDDKSDLDMMIVTSRGGQIHRTQEDFLSSGRMDVSMNHIFTYEDDTDELSDKREITDQPLENVFFSNVEKIPEGTFTIVLDHEGREDGKFDETPFKVEVFDGTTSKIYQGSIPPNYKIIVGEYEYSRNQKD